MSSNTGLLLRVAKASFFHGKTTAQPVLPAASVEKNQLHISPGELRDFNRLTGWEGKQASAVHPCFLHILAFPMHLELLLNEAFPFPILGLVHLDNEINQYAWPDCHLPIDIRCQFGALDKHRKGWLFAIETEVYQGEQLIWRETSRNLYRTRHPEFDVLPPDTPPRAVSGRIQQHWTLDSGLGREYAKVSGDYNPIHLWPLTARLFGFPRHIAHGMWSKARCMSALDVHELAQLRCFVTFKKPILLPARVTFDQADRPGGRSFSLANLRNGDLHLCGELATECAPG